MKLKLVIITVICMLLVQSLVVNYLYYNGTIQMQSNESSELSIASVLANQ